ncbi:hypothetical protein SNE35_28040 [Paucibacter sp. R3-3]|uniref:Uncharacterized protein n=1 Tax=Roseateles agri TaxID=3098619 RepID=A0ABU5DPX9_9BURK|nr:hypothetical protein [Paucibacter sp. R3-3]MDY0748382.1 hypothetical protein [Paucibacter sp. R3-3]
MSQEEWRDARLKKALDSAPDVDARPAEAVREAILHKARLTAAAAAQPAVQRAPRVWRWLGSLAAVGALAVVLIGGRQMFLTKPSLEEAAPQVATAPAPVESAKVAEAVVSPPVVVADASPPPSRKAAVQAKKPVVVAAAPPPPAIVAEATAPPPAAAAAPAAPAVAADAAWTVVRIATADGPVLLRREQLSSEAAGRLNRLLAQAETGQLRTQLADERQANSAARALARAPASPGLLHIELLRGDQPLGSLVLSPGDPLRQEIETAAAAKPASAP